MSVDLNRIKRIHCIGIGGIGVSAIARMMVLQGKRVTGSDSGRSPVTDALKSSGIRVMIGHAAANVPPRTDLVVYTKAVPETNPELREAKKRGIPCFSYAEILGQVSKGMFTIAISGAHGKTTTTAMVGKILRDAKLKPTVIVGGIMLDVGSNFVGGTGPYFVVEACEYKRSFLDLNPRIVVVTNIDNDHLDYYKNLANIKYAFGEFVGKLGAGDWLICDSRDKNVRTIARKAKCRVLDFSRAPENLKLAVIGEHNQKNAEAAYVVARLLGVPDKTIRHSLATFRGVGRRFEYKGVWQPPAQRAIRPGGGVRFYDDYAHHPTEIRATLRAAREALGRRTRIWVVFQPHLYSRTKLLIGDFAKSFNDATHVLLADIYAAREKDDGTVHARDLAAKIAKRVPATYLGSFATIAGFLMGNAKRGDVVITMGAGEAYKVFDILRATRTR